LCAPLLAVLWAGTLPVCEGRAAEGISGTLLKYPYCELGSPCPIKASDGGRFFVGGVDRRGSNGLVVKLRTSGVTDFDGAPVNLTGITVRIALAVDRSPCTRYEWPNQTIRNGRMVVTLLGGAATPVFPEQRGVARLCEGVELIAGSDELFGEELIIVDSFRIGWDRDSLSG
jgi:hypothetical protein